MQRSAYWWWLVMRKVNRCGELDGVEQLTRYLDLLNRDPLLAPVHGVFAAQLIKPQARTLAEVRVWSHSEGLGSLEKAVEIFLSRWDSDEYAADELVANLRAAYDQVQRHCPKSED